MTTTYAVPTTSTLSDSEGTAGAAPSEFLLAGRASCAGTALELFPEHEEHHVPANVAAMCRTCPLRGACLRWALTVDGTGYWAGSTTAERHELARAGEASLAALAQLQAATASTHPGRPGTITEYKKGCRCHDCRRVNATRVSQQRARRAA